MAKFTPPSGREHPPKGPGGSVGGAHNAGKLHNPSAPLKKQAPPMPMKNMPMKGKKSAA
jgi:hypothetical protein